jgi:hypothetical protein
MLILRSKNPISKLVPFIRRYSNTQIHRFKDRDFKKVETNYNRKKTFGTKQNLQNLRKHEGSDDIKENPDLNNQQQWYCSLISNAKNMTNLKLVIEEAKEKGLMSHTVLYLFFFACVELFFVSPTVTLFVFFRF